MPINVKGKIATFTGKDLESIQCMSKKLGLTMQNCFTGMMWEYVMKKAREGAFKNAKKGKKGESKA